MQSKQPALMISLAAPEDAAWLIQWERHLLPLQQAKHLYLWSERLVVAGENRLQQMNQQIDQADFIVFLLSADFFASDDCMRLMEHVLMRQHNKKVTLVPLLLRPSTWQDSPLGTLSCLPPQAQAVTTWDNADEAFQTCVEGIRQLLGLPMRDRAQKRPLPLPLRQRLQVIQMVQQEYHQRLSHSLQGQVEIELILHERTDTIASSARIVFHDVEAEHSLPTGTTIIQVYDRARFGLLIMGAPGAGKTTLLLDLAIELLQRAENDLEHPLPIILSLSSWATKKRALVEWLPEELYLVYGIAKKVGASWIEQDQVLLLLDGLDEMDASARLACVAAINHYRAEHFIPLVISSRSREYEQQQARLILPTAVEIQPLELAAVMAYLTQAGPELATIRTAIQTNRTLQQLMTTPLMLIIALLAYRDQEAHGLPQSGSLKELQRQIFEKYVQHMLQRHEHRRIFSGAQTFHSLVWLAQQMQRHHLTEFYLEIFQKDWLETKDALIIYRLISRLSSGMIFGLFGWLLVELVFGLINGLIFGWVGEMIFGIVGGLIFGMIGSLTIELPDIEPVEKFTWSWKRFKDGLFFGWGLGTLFSRPPLGLLFGLGYGFSGVLPSKTVRLKPNQGIHTSGWNALRIGLLFFLILGVISGLVSGLGGGLISGLVSGLVGGLLAGLVSGLVFGGVTYFHHYVLRLFLAQSRALPWRAVQFLEEAADCILLHRVGSGYRFIHPLLQEHFASLDVETVLEQSEG